MKRRSSRQQNAWKLASDSSGDWLLPGLLLGAIITAFFGSMLYAGLTADQNDIRESQFEYVRMLQAANQGTVEQAEADVKVVASSILLSHDWGSESLGMDDARFVGAMQIASKTGTVPELTMDKGTWGEYRQVWIPGWLASIIALAWLGFSFFYVWGTFKRKEYLADLRWSHPATITFALLATPLLLPTFAVSGVRMARNAERDKAEARARAEAQKKKKALKGSTPEFESDHDGALEAYRLARNVATAENVERKKVELSGEIEDLTTERVELSTHMREVQQQRIIALASLVELEKLDVDLLGSIDDEQIAVEFNRLIAFKGVEYVRPYDKDGLRMFVTARIEHEGVLYDLGDWDLYITRTNVEAIILRSGLRDDWDEYKHPSYRNYNKTFCFGDHMRKLRDHAVRGQILEAISVAVQCLNSVSEGDEDKISLAFKPVKKEKNDVATTSDAHSQ